MSTSCEIISISQRPEGTNYVVKVPDAKNKYGYDLVNVLKMTSGAVSTSSASRSTITPLKASKFVQKYLEADLVTRETMRGPFGKHLP